MALIKCPECETEISDKTKKCPKCGYKVSKFSFNTKKIIVLIFLLIIIIISSVLIYRAINEKIQEEKEQARIEEIITTSKELIEKSRTADEFTYQKIYYNEDENATVVYFTLDEKEDIAVVHLNTNEVGSQMIYEFMGFAMNLTTDEEQRQTIAENIIADAYDPVYVNNVENGDETWKLIYEND